MFKLPKSIAWLRDIVEILFLDRLDPTTKHISELASTACRTFRFHSHSLVRQQPLEEIIRDLKGTSAESVILPGPLTDLGDVGNQTCYYTLGSIVRAIDPSLILETGTYLGVSAAAMAFNSKPDCKIFTVDLPDTAGAEKIHELNHIDELHIETSRKRVGEAFLRSSIRDKVTQIREDSMTFRAERILENVDLVFVDGGHSTPVIAKDTENAFRVLADDGVIIWDDYFHLYPDVVGYLDELSKRLPLRGIEGTNYVIYSRHWDTSGKSSISA